MSGVGTFETFGRDVRMSARGETGHCGNIVVGPNLTQSCRPPIYFAALHSRGLPRQEPGALAAHAGICAGGRGAVLVPTATMTGLGQREVGTPRDATYRSGRPRPIAPSARAWR